MGAVFAEFGHGLKGLRSVANFELVAHGENTSEGTADWQHFVTPIDAHAQLCGASLVSFFDFRLGSVEFRTEIRTEPVETITRDVGPDRELNLRPPARSSLKHGFANVHIAHAA